MPISTFMPIRHVVLISMAFIGASTAWAHDEYALQGDVGVAVYRTPPISRTPDRSNTVLPYVYADAGPFYARINTFGYKAMPLGAGHLELATRLTFEGYKSSYTGIAERSNPMPVGVGTLQKTAYGAFFLYDFYDTTSGGHLLDVTYALKFNGAGMRIYPQLGFEYRSAKYVQHLYGVSADDATRSRLSPYTAHGATTPHAGVAIEYPLGDHYSLTYQVKSKWLSHGITDSPLVDAKRQTISVLALTRSFK